MTDNTEYYKLRLRDELLDNVRLHRELDRSFRRAGLFWFPLGWVFGALIQVLVGWV